LRSSARVFLIALLFSATCLGQYRSPADSATEGNVYTNFFFRFRYAFTSSWVPQAATVAADLPEAEQARLNESGGTQKAGKLYYLLTLFRNLPGQGVAGHSRAVISMIAEDVSSNTQISGGKDCVLKLAERMKKSRYTPVGGPQEMQIGGHTFFRQDMKGTLAGAPVYQTAIFTTSGGYAVGFLLITPNQPLLTHMVGTVKGLQFY
jgi:hypothetical protein